MKNLPLGIQTFEKIIKNNYLYIDKTKHIYSLINSTKGDYFFLSRPRRFGKSLLVSTLKDIFLGKKELFSKLWLSSSDYTWESYPVIHLDFSRIVHNTPDELKQDLVRHIHRIAHEYNVVLAEKVRPEKALDELVVHLSTRNPVVILIDEYDKPIKVS